MSELGKYATIFSNSIVIKSGSTADGNYLPSVCAFFVFSKGVWVSEVDKKNIFRGAVALAACGIALLIYGILQM
ncbi:hypothetical protein [Paenibacillus sp. KN14-4R]|uniref:hypothetical protein n=1 Tax=Paenibacillus sp. KN14-4R TaxID=3445773 RepID=UPI003FA04347